MMEYKGYGPHNSPFCNQTDFEMLYLSGNLVMTLILCIETNVENKTK